MKREKKKLHFIQIETGRCGTVAATFIYYAYICIFGVKP